MRGFPGHSSQERMRTKKLRHGLPPSRAKGGYLPGTLPDPASVRLLLGEARNATLNPPRGQKPCTWQHVDIGDRAWIRDQLHTGLPLHRGWRKPSGTAVGHREQASRGYGKGGAGTVPVYRGTVAGDGYCLTKSRTTMLTYLVPMPRFSSWGDTGRPTVPFSLPKKSGGNADG